MAGKKKETPGKAEKDIDSLTKQAGPGHSRGRSPHEEKPACFPVVAIGASAGGLDPIQRFFDHVPENSGIAFIVITHLDPRHSSIMPVLVQRHTKAKVHQVENGMQVQPDNVYVIPPDSVMSIRNGTLRLLPLDTSARLRLPIDTLFNSLAEDRKEYAVGIILSGMGSDGTIGVQSVKRELGMVMAQDPETTSYPSMPLNAVKTGLVDYVLKPEDMPSQLVDYVKRFVSGTAARTPYPETIPQSDMEKVHQLLRSVTGHDFSHYKPSTIIRRVYRRMHIHRIENVSGYVGYMTKTPHEVKALFRELLIGVTGFFRDREAFDALKDKALKELLTDKPPGFLLRAWVAGCSTGEEAYSTAIILDECREQLGSDFEIQIFATDIDDDAVEKARQGVYPAGISADVSPERLGRYFDSEDDTYRIKKRLREMLVFAPQSVIKDPPYTKLDLITCRNLLIYLDASQQKILVPLFHYSLNPGGILFLGSSETIGEFTNLFSPIDAKWKLYKRRQDASYTYPLMGFPLTPAKRHVDTGKTTRNKPLNLAAVFEEDLLEHHTPPAVVFDRKGDIVYIHGLTGKYLQPAQGTVMTYNIFEMARKGLKSQLSALIRKASGEMGKLFSRKLIIHPNGQPVQVNVTIKAMNEPVGELFMVLFEEIPFKEIRARGEKVHEQGAGREEEINSLYKELQDTRESLRASIEDLGAANEELRSTNEEYQSTNEELQSTNEELNSSKEELQSLNEELETVNRELQEKIQETQDAYSDMRNFLNGLDIPVVFLNNELRIQRFNSSAATIINLIETDIGRGINQITSNLRDVDILEESREVLQRLQEKKREVLSKEGRWYLMRIQPYLTPDRKINGVILSFVDIHELKTALEDLTSSEAGLRDAKDIFDDLPMPLLVLDQELTVISANPYFHQAFPAQGRETLGAKLYEMQGGSWDVWGLKNLIREVIVGTGEVVRGEFELAFPETGLKKVEVTARMLLHDGKDTGRILLMIRDTAA